MLANEVVERLTKHKDFKRVGKTAKPLNTAQRTSRGAFDTAIEQHLVFEGPISQDHYIDYAAKTHTGGEILIGLNRRTGVVTCGHKAT